ncbi:MAG TPA: energy transducer TonB [Casimicrobiaceae bacterium]|nr:energy transducer TonB [Casimicrobiaceae bacterium]
MLVLASGCATTHVVDLPGASHDFSTIAILCGWRKLTNAYSFAASGCELGLSDAGKRVIAHPDVFSPSARENRLPRFYEAYARRTGADAFVVCTGGQFAEVNELGDLTLTLVDARTGAMTRTIFVNGHGRGFDPESRARVLCRQLVSGNTSNAVARAVATESTAAPTEPAESSPETSSPKRRDWCTDSIELYGLALKANGPGTVQVRVTVNAEGGVTAASVESGIGDPTDNVAVDVAKRFVSCSRAEQEREVVFRMHFAVGMKEMPLINNEACALATEYPPQALERRETAVVHLYVLLDDQGRVARSLSKRPIGLGFDEAAQEALEQRCVFTPALDKDGRPVPFVIYDYTVNFQLAPK